MNRYVKVFTNRRILVTLLLGFSSGVPLNLTLSTMQAWLSNAKVDITTIGLFSLVGLPYAMKFLWAPLMDAKALPFLGLRRGWMVVAQLGLFISTIGLALSNPSTDITAFALMALLVAFFSASQDIVVDAYRSEIITEEAELGAGASAYITGYRIGTVISGGVGLVLSDHMSWSSVYLIMAAVNLIGLVTVLCSSEPQSTRKANRRFNFRESVMTPFTEFFQRGGAMEILIFIMIYKISTLMATALTTKFLIDLGYTNTAIGSVNKGIGIFATIAGVVTGGSLMAKLGLKRSLWIFGIVQSLVGLTFCFLARASAGAEESKYFWLVTVVSLDNYMMGLGTAALVGFMMNFCSKVYTATQYALLSSVIGVSRVILIAHAGTLVAFLGYDWFFILTVPMAIPGLLLLSRYDHWEKVSTSVQHTRIPTADRALIAVFVVSLICLSMDPLLQFLHLKQYSSQVALIGAIGVVLVVIGGLLRPYLSPRRSLPQKA